MTLPKDYVERVYAGVLGKLIGVYSGRPFEGWSHERIMAELGQINYFVNEALGLPLVVTDDDIAGTFTFLRALEDYGPSSALTAEQLGHTWLNYIIERRTTLWWGGMGNSTEHTAFLRLKQGVTAPQSGSSALNGKVLAEQIGAQIFIDGWAMVSPGNPRQAAALAEQAARVSHDGVAVHAARFLAAMEAQAFIEEDIEAIIDVGLTFIPEGSLIGELVEKMRHWYQADGDWKATRARIAKSYGYDKYGGNCHVVPNHAIILLSLLYGEDDFQKALMIANTSGWDTDCNAGNVGCLMGIKQGLAAFEGANWRGPIADRLYVPSADGGGAISDAVAETTRIVNLGLALAGQESLSFKNGAKFHFELPGSVQGFQTEVGSDLRLENVCGFSTLGTRSLAIHYEGNSIESVARVFTPTFIPPEATQMPGYELLASPTLYPGQTVKAGLRTANDQSPLKCRLYLQVYGAQDQLELYGGPLVTVPAGEEASLEWIVPETGGAAVTRVGLALEGMVAGTLYLDYLTWSGEPKLRLGRPASAGSMWQRAWVDAVDHFGKHWPEAFRVSQNHGRGLLIQGTREWRNYRVSSTISLQAARAGGIAVRVQGLRRYYALLLRGRNEVVLVRYLETESVLSREDFPWDFGVPYNLALEVRNEHLTAWINDQLIFEIRELKTSLDTGGVALLCEEGTLSTDEVVVSGLVLPRL